MRMLLIFSVIAALAFMCERVIPERSLPVLRRGFFADVMYVVMNILIRVVFTNTLALSMTSVGQQVFPPGSVDLVSAQPVWIQAIAVIVVLDFAAYWMHRGKHRFGWWWRLHAIHHSSADLDWFSSVRFHPVEKILDRIIYLLPLMILGASEEAILILASVDALVASFAHANARIRFGPLNYVIVGPELHRIHHSSQLEHQGRNFGNNLSIFDWIFGTATLSDEPPAQYGLDDEGFDHENILNQLAYPFRRDFGS